MAKNNNVKDFTKDIADAIRTKKGTTDKINPQNFSDEILSLSAGVSGELLITENDTYDVSSYATAVVDVPVEAGCSVESVVNEDGLTQTLVIVCVVEDSPTLTFSRTFSENTPAQISAVSAQISANNMTSSQVAETYGWNIGDTISYQLTTGENVEMRIIGFNHDDKSDGSGKAGITLDMTHSLKTKYPMMSSNDNNGGYPASVMRSTHLPAIKSTLPTEWQNIIKLVNKKSANGGSNNYTETLTTSEDLFILSEIEVFGSASFAKDGANEGVVYEYWNGRTKEYRIKKYDSNNDGTLDTNYQWWLRSSGQNVTDGTCTVSETGTENLALCAGDYIATSYAFCI